MTIETTDDISKKSYSKMETEVNRKCPSSQDSSAEEQKCNLQLIKTSDKNNLSGTTETLTTSQRSGFMITDILSGGVARNSAAATLDSLAVLPNLSSPSQSHTSIMAAAAAAVAEKDFRARISAAAAALSVAAQFTPQTIAILPENHSRTEILHSSPVGSQLFVHPHAAAAVSSGGKFAPISQATVNELSGDDLSDHDSVSGKGETSGCFDLGKVVHYKFHIVHA